jgi:hypothetical protein
MADMADMEEVEDRAESGAFSGPPCPAHALAPQTCGAMLLASISPSRLASRTTVMLIASIWAVVLLLVAL